LKKSILWKLKIIRYDSKLLSHLKFQITQNLLFNSMWNKKEKKILILLSLQSYLTRAKEITLKLWLCLFSRKWFPGNHFPNFHVLFAIRKVGQRKTLSSQRKIWLGFQESVFLENLSGKHFPEVVKNLEMLLFVDHIKFDPQTFNCYIYFVLNIYFLISSLKI
jgi:hypothetical protein